MNIRKSVGNLTDLKSMKTRSAFDNMMIIKDDRGYGHLAGIHGIPDNKCKHGESDTISDPSFRLFLPWHRAYLYWFERYLQDAQKDASITVPWWDWTSNASRTRGIPKAFSQESANGKPNPLNKFHVIVPENVNLDSLAEEGIVREREFDTHREPLLPSLLNAYTRPEKIENLLSLHDYGDFSDQLEDTHNYIHGWVGGNDGDMVGYLRLMILSFWSHHCMIDRLFWLWQLRPGNSLPLYLHDEVWSHSS